MEKISEGCRILMGCFSFATCWNAKFLSELLFSKLLRLLQFLILIFIHF